MQFVTNGPDIPDALLQVHEEGRVVFFCGAGVSYPAGLPSFKGLVEAIYQLNGTATGKLSARLSVVGNSTVRSTFWSDACQGNAKTSAVR